MDKRVDDHALAVSHHVPLTALLMAFLRLGSSSFAAIGYATIALSAAALYFTKIGPYSLLAIVGLFYLGLALWQDPAFVHFPE
jgi:hypothetical protein